MNKSIPVILGYLLLFFAAWIQTTSIPFVHSIVSRFENIAYDIQLRTKLYTIEGPLVTSISIVDIDDKSLRREGRWPWPRSKFVELIKKLKESGVVVIAFDMIFPDQELNIANLVLQELKKKNILTPTFESTLKKISIDLDNDVQFAKELLQTEAVLGFSFVPRPGIEGSPPKPILTLTTNAEKQLGFITAQGIIGNTPVIATAAHNTGFINVLPDDDAVIRRVPLLIRYQNDLYPSLALEAVRLYLLTNIKLVTAYYANSLRIEGVKIGAHVIPTDEKSQVAIPFRGSRYTFPYLSATDVLHGHVRAKYLQGKIVFIGSSATGVGDLNATAIENSFPGIEIQATIADSILKNNFYHKPAWALGVETLLTLTLGLMMILTFPRLGPRTLSFLIIIIPPILIFANNFFWEKTGFVISVFIPIFFTVILAIINIAYGYLSEMLRREHLKKIFDQYVPSTHIDEMLKTNDDFGLHGEDREMTVLFADIRNFTTISEPMTASQLKEMLNNFLTPMTELIFKHRGTVDKYVGDMIIAFWGAPLKDAQHARHAIETALDMQHALTKVNQDFAKQHLPKIHLGIGLNTGVMSVGDMGSLFRRSYTVLGDAVNLGSRIEELTKYYGVKIIVTESTHQHQKKFIFRKLDRVQVKGKHTHITIYEVICRKKELMAELQTELNTHHEALEYYFQQEWALAKNLFEQLNQHYPNKLYELYLSRIESFIKTPPGQDWDGVFIYEEK